MLPTSQCARCKHFRADVREANVCAAFPDGIPLDIIADRHDHKLRYLGDHGIRFEVKPEWTDLYSASSPPAP